MKRPLPSFAGFTLLELLVALTVFAVMSGAAYSGLRSVLLTRSAVEQQQRRLAALQLTVFRLEQDITQAVPRSIRDEYGDLQPALLGGELRDYPLVLTRSGWDNPLRQPRATLQRVAYRLREGRLWRLHWDVLDRGSQMPPRELVLLDQVQDFGMRFLDQQNNWRNAWPPRAEEQPEMQQSFQFNLLPRAVEITFTLEDWGTITRLVLLPG